MSKSTEERRTTEQKGIKEFESAEPPKEVKVDFKILERLVEATERLNITSRVLSDKVDKLEKEKGQTTLE